MQDLELRTFSDVLGREHDHDLLVRDPGPFLEEQFPILAVLERLALDVLSAVAHAWHEHVALHQVQGPVLVVHLPAGAFRHRKLNVVLANYSGFRAKYNLANS